MLSQGLEGTGNGRYKPALVATPFPLWHVWQFLTIRPTSLTKPCQWNFCSNMATVLSLPKCPWLWCPSTSCLLKEHLGKHSFKPLNMNPSCKLYCGNTILFPCCKACMIFHCLSSVAYQLLNYSKPTTCVCISVTRLTLLLKPSATLLSTTDLCLIEKINCWRKVTHLACL